MSIGYSIQVENKEPCCSAACFIVYIREITQYKNIKILTQCSKEHTYTSVHSKLEHMFKTCFLVVLFNEVYC